MRKVVVFNRVSVDGYFAGPNGEIDWFVPDPEVDKAAHELMQADTVLFGRVTYQMFESFWRHVAADANAPKEARSTARELDQMAKVVFSKTMKGVTWKNTILVKGGVPLVVKKIKEVDGPDVAIFGSGSIIQQLVAESLIDEYLIVLTPVILGAGNLLFKDTSKFNLKLLGTKTFDSQNVLLHYGLAGG